MLTDTNILLTYDMGRYAFEVLVQCYFKFRILSCTDICTALVYLSRRYSLCIKLNAYHSPSRCFQMNIYQADIFYSSTGPSLLKRPFISMASLEDFHNTGKSFPRNETTWFLWPALYHWHFHVRFCLPFPQIQTHEFTVSFFRNGE